MSTELKQVFVVDGKNFETKAEALDYIRRPKVLEALMKVTSNNKPLSEFLLDKQETIESAFEVGTIQRVTKSERKHLEKALEAIKAADKKEFAFVAENAGAILESFRWPGVKRMAPEEKETCIKNTLVGIAENPEVADWIIANKVEILACYEAGKEKRAVNPAAQNALAEYRAKKAAEKAAAEAQG